MKQTITLKERLQELIDHRTESNTEQRQITTGHVDLDQLMGGLRLPSINIVASKPGNLAKETVFSLLYRIASDGVPAGMVYTSYNEYEVFYWHFSSVTKEPSGTFLLSDSRELQLKVLRRAQEKTGDIPLHFNTRKPVSFRDFMDQLQLMVNTGVKLIAVDSLIDIGQISAERNNENHLNQQEVWSRLFQLRDFAEQNRIALLIAHKVLEESGYTYAPHPRLEELVWGNAVDNVADTVLLTHWPQRYGLEYDSFGDHIENNEIELTLVKNEFGRIGKLNLEVKGEPNRLQ